MSLPWKRVSLVRVPAKPDGLWELALEYVGGSRLLRFQVVSEDGKEPKPSAEWKLTASQPSTANGINPGASTPATGNASTAGILDVRDSKTWVCTSARRGALVGKIGGSTADFPDAVNTATPYGTKKVFAVGTLCIMQVGATEGGPVFLTMNDSPAGFGDHAGELHVLIEEYLL